MVALRGERSSRPRRTIRASALGRRRRSRCCEEDTCDKRSLGLTLFGGLAIIVAACGGGATPESVGLGPGVGPASESAAGESAAPASRPPRSSQAAVDPQDRRRHRHRHAERQELQRVLVQGRPGRRGRRSAPPSRSRSSRPRAADYATVDPVVRRPGLRRDRHRRLQPRRGHRRGRRSTTRHQVHRRRPVADLHHRRRQARTSRSPARPTRRRSPRTTRRSRSRRTRPATSPGSSRPAPSKTRHDRRDRRDEHLRPVRPLHPGLRARREVGQARHQGRQRVRHERLRSEAAFQDQAGGKTFAENFLAQNKDVDVLFQVAGLTGNGVLDAACAARRSTASASTSTSSSSYPNAGPCLLTSAEKHLQLAVSGCPQGRRPPARSSRARVLYDAKNDGIGVSPGHDLGDRLGCPTPGARRRGARGHEGRVAQDLPRRTAARCSSRRRVAHANPTAGRPISAGPLFVYLFDLTPRSPRPLAAGVPRP